MFTTMIIMYTVSFKYSNLDISKSFNVCIYVSGLWICQCMLASIFMENWRESSRLI